MKLEQMQGDLLRISDMYFERDFEIIKFKLFLSLPLIFTNRIYEWNSEKSYGFYLPGHIVDRLSRWSLFSALHRPPSSGMGSAGSVHVGAPLGPLTSSRGRQRNSVAVVDSREHIYEELELCRGPPKLAPVSGVLPQVSTWFVVWRAAILITAIFYSVLFRYKIMFYHNFLRLLSVDQMVEETKNATGIYCILVQYLVYCIIISSYLQRRLHSVLSYLLSAALCIVVSAILQR